MTDSSLLERESQSGAWIESTENVLFQLREWQREGLRTTLATLVGIEGSSPRTLGAQMAIAGEGRAAGHISGGCLEGALIAEAQIAMRGHKNRLVRYGKGSKYIDIQLPCGSGLDIYFDQEPPRALIERICAELEGRKPAALKIDLETGESRLLTGAAAGATGIGAARQGRMFVRGYAPRLRLVIAGAGPAVLLLAQLAHAMDMEIKILTPEAPIAQEARFHGLAAKELVAGKTLDDLELDAWTAAVLLFHDHAWELPFLQTFLGSPCFYLGAVGSQRTHEARQAALAGIGASPAAAARLRGPAGLIPKAKQPRELAVSILAEIVLEAKEKGLL
jgi:xanthine dehydrogenase accessory factor